MSSLLDSMRTSLSALFERIGDDEDGPVRELAPAELRRILEERARHRRKKPVKIPIARRASSDPEARRARERMAKERMARVGRAREERDRAANAEREAAFAEAKRRAEAEARAEAQRTRRARTQPGPGAGASAGPRRTSAGGAPRGAGFGGLGRDPEMAKHYKTLDLPYGADMDQVKKAFRKLIRRFHPDLHAGNPKKQKAASELSKQLTTAYNELERQLTGGPNQG